MFVGSHFFIEYSLKNKMCLYCVAGIELDKNVNFPFWMQTHLQKHFQNDKLVFNTNDIVEEEKDESRFPFLT